MTAAEARKLTIQATIDNNNQLLESVFDRIEAHAALASTRCSFDESDGDLSDIASVLLYMGYECHFMGDPIGSELVVKW